MNCIQGTGVRSGMRDTERGYFRSIHAVDKTLRGASRSGAQNGDGPVSCKGRRKQAGTRQEGDGPEVGYGSRGEARVNKSSIQRKPLWRVGEPENGQPGGLHGAKKYLSRRRAVREFQLAFSVHVMRWMNEGAAMKCNFLVLAKSCEAQVRVGESPHLRQRITAKDR